MDESMSGWDRSVEMAWVRFQRKLGDFLADLDAGATTVIETLVSSDPQAGTGPFIRFAALPDQTSLRAEAAGNRHLAAPYRLGRAQIGQLEAAGWTPPGDSTDGRDHDSAHHTSDQTFDHSDRGNDGSGGSPFFTVVLPRDRADLIALMSVRALRDVYAVPHPALLQGGPLEAPPVAEPAVPATEPELDLLQLLRPESPEELDRYVEQTLRVVLGREAFRDEDGDFPIRVGSVMMFVRPLQTEPVVEVFSPLIRDIGDREQALIEVSILNRDTEFISYHVGGSTIVARMHVPAFPFVPNHLAALLSRMAETLDGADDDLALRVHGRLWLDVEGTAVSGGDGDLASDDEASGVMSAEMTQDMGDLVGDEFEDRRAGSLGVGLDDELDELDELDDEFGAVDESTHRFERGAEPEDAEVEESGVGTEAELPPELLALIQVDAEGVDRQPPELVAGLFRGDMHLVLQSIRLSEEQTIAWRESTAEALAQGDEEEAAACAHEMRAWEKTVSDLRGALRHIVASRTPGTWSS